VTYLRIDYESVEPLDGPDAAAHRFDLDTNRLLMHGGCGITLWFGPASTASADAAPLRVDVDAEADRAALRWQPDGLYAVELAPDHPIEVWESHDTAAVTIPARLARVSVDTARRAVVEYVTTGERPTVVSWQPAG